MEDEKMVQVLFGKPVEDKVALNNGTVEKVWLHPMKQVTEKVVCLARFRETLNLMKESGSEDGDCRDAANFSYVVQELLFSCRKGEDPKADRFFKNAKQVIDVVQEAWRLHEVYTEAFEATEEVLGESSRATT